MRPTCFPNIALVAPTRSYCIFLAGLAGIRWFFHIILHGEHIIVLYAVSECLDGHFRSEHLILNTLGLPYKIIDILEQTAGDLIVGPGVLAVLVK